MATITQGNYKGYKEHLRILGWVDKPTILDQNSEDFVYLTNIHQGDNYRNYKFICIKCPHYTKIRIDVSHSLGLHITDENGIEIPDDTKIRLIYVEPSVIYFPILRVLYSEIKMKNEIPKCKLKKLIKLRHGTYLHIAMINSKNYVPEENIKFKMSCDIWNKKELNINNIDYVMKSEIKVDLNDK